MSNACLLFSGKVRAVKTSPLLNLLSEIEVLNPRNLSSTIFATTSSQEIRETSGEEPVPLPSNVLLFHHFPAVYLLYYHMY